MTNDPNARSEAMMAEARVVRRALLQLHAARRYLRNLGIELRPKPKPRTRRPALRVVADNDDPPESKSP